MKLFGRKTPTAHNAFAGSFLAFINGREVGRVVVAIPGEWLDPIGLWHKAGDLEIWYYPTNASFDLPAPCLSLDSLMYNIFDFDRMMKGAN